MRLIRLIHKWGGLIIGLFFAVLALSGMVILSGRIFGSYAPMFRWAKQLHTTLFLDDFGRTLVSFATLVAAIEILTGYLLWGQRMAALTRSYRRKRESRWKSVVKSLSFTFPNKLSGWHNAGGAWSGIPLLIMILTALTWCYGWYHDAIYFLFDNADPSDWEHNLFHTLSRLHTGSFSGITSQLIWLVAVTLGASLPITGFLLFLKRRKSPRTNHSNPR